MTAIRQQGRESCRWIRFIDTQRGKDTIGEKVHCSKCMCDLSPNVAKARLLKHTGTASRCMYRLGKLSGPRRVAATGISSHQTFWDVLTRVLRTRAAVVSRTHDSAAAEIAEASVWSGPGGQLPGVGRLLRIVSGFAPD